MQAHTLLELCFNIRSFGSWIASLHPSGRYYELLRFQYPLFRIVDCFHDVCRSSYCRSTFQYPLFRIVDCFLQSSGQGGGATPVSISALSDRGLLLDGATGPEIDVGVSISALSDRGLLPDATIGDDIIKSMFQYPLFRIVDCFCVNDFSSSNSICCFNIRSFGSWIASQP